SWFHEKVGSNRWLVERYRSIERLLRREFFGRNSKKQKQTKNLREGKNLSLGADGVVFSKSA
ncbi:MAG TPA: hypothetical protein VFW31_07470, partial [Candidatus Angelobacter sp.]|nr:hypothetical protein [Candidatus Angelobacter sp.]